MSAPTTVREQIRRELTAITQEGGVPASDAQVDRILALLPAGDVWAAARRYVLPDGSLLADWLAKAVGQPADGSLRTELEVLRDRYSRDVGDITLSDGWRFCASGVVTELTAVLSSHLAKEAPRPEPSSAEGPLRIVDEWAERHRVTGIWIDELRAALAAERAPQAPAHDPLTATATQPDIEFCAACGTPLGVKEAPPASEAPGLPPTEGTPNAVTLAAMAETEAGAVVNRASMKDLLADLDADPPASEAPKPRRWWETAPCYHGPNCKGTGIDCGPDQRARRGPVEEGEEERDA